MFDSPNQHDTVKMTAAEVSALSNGFWTPATLLRDEPNMFLAGPTDVPPLMLDDVDAVDLSTPARLTKPEDHPNYAEHVEAVKRNLGYVKVVRPPKSERKNYDKRRIYGTKFYIEIVTSRTKKCPVCDKSVGRENLESHILCEHLHKRPSNLACSKCLKRYPATHNLRDHEKRCRVGMDSADEPPKKKRKARPQYQCMCDFTTDNENDAKTHFYHHLFERGEHGMHLVDYGQRTPWLPGNFKG